jgi:hypothetical protein
MDYTNSHNYFKEKETFTALILSDRTKKVLTELRIKNQHLLSITHAPLYYITRLSE